jgi:hypothetical protein
MIVLVRHCMALHRPAGSGALAGLPRHNSNHLKSFYFHSLAAGRHQRPAARIR